VASGVFPVDVSRCPLRNRRWPTDRDSKVMEFHFYYFSPVPQSPVLYGTYSDTTSPGRYPLGPAHPGEYTFTTAHQPTHSNITPTNLLLSVDLIEPNTFSPILLDLGLEKECEACELARAWGGPAWFGAACEPRVSRA
jgi:hypothetical protein